MKAALGRRFDNEDTLEGELRELQEAANAINRQVIVVRASTPSEIDAAFATIKQQAVGGLLIGQDAFFGTRRDQLLTAAAELKLPVIYYQREYVDAGGLFSYGANFSDGFRQAGVYVGKLLKGAK